MQPDQNTRILSAAVLVIAGGALIWLAYVRTDVVFTIAALAGGIILIVMSAGLAIGQHLRGLNIGVGKTKMEFSYYERIAAAPTIPPRMLDEQTVAEKKLHVDEVKKGRRLPGQNAPRYSALASISADDLLVRPSAYPMTPMYLLDSGFRILDWNEAFSVAFDRTMEGRQGESVLEWTYFLDNFKEVLEHGVKTFGDSNKLPHIDVEDIEYTSQRYGKLKATKRAYQVPDDTEACLAWLVTLDVRFCDPEQQIRFQRDLVSELGKVFLWSEYSLSYDRLLNSTKVYPDLLDKLAGGFNGVRAMPPDARIIDLGAGTGNLTRKLITSGPDRAIVAVENNRMMLDFLKAKCKPYLRTDVDSSGVVALKQDITSLYGLPPNQFDFAIMNNVLYAVEDAQACLKEARKVLKPGGELRLSGPRKDTRVNVLFDRIRKDLEESGRFADLEPDYWRVLEINKRKLRPMLHRWSRQDVEKMLLDAGFSQISYSSEDVYAGQSMLVCAVK